MGLFDKIAAWFGWDTPRPEPGTSGPQPEASGPSPGRPSKRRDADVDVGARAAAVGKGAPGADVADEPKTRTTWAEDAEIESGARALIEGGDFAAGLALLRQRAVLLAAHAPTSLPCLCVRCLEPELAHAEAEGGGYARDFVVTRRHVLFYWAPLDLGDEAARLRPSMRAAVRQQLRASSKDERGGVWTGIDPFTKQPRTIVPRSVKSRTNPFTGKPIP